MWCMIGLVIAAPVSCAVFALGRFPTISGPVAAFTFLVMTTYRNSWGQLFHTENLVALHLVVLAHRCVHLQRTALGD